MVDSMLRKSSMLISRNKATRGVFRIMPNIYDGGFAKIAKNRYLFPKNSPSWMFDRILNTPLLSLDFSLKQLLLQQL